MLKSFLTKRYYQNSYGIHTKRRKVHSEIIGQTEKIQQQASLRLRCRFEQSRKVKFKTPFFLSLINLIEKSLCNCEIVFDLSNFHSSVMFFWLSSRKCLRVSLVFMRFSFEALNSTLNSPWSTSWIRHFQPISELGYFEV